LVYESDEDVDIPQTVTEEENIGIVEESEMIDEYEDLYQMSRVKTSETNIYFNETATLPGSFDGMKFQSALWNDYKRICNVKIRKSIGEDTAVDSETYIRLYDNLVQLNTLSSHYYYFYNNYCYCNFTRLSVTTLTPQNKVSITIFYIKLISAAGQLQKLKNLLKDHKRLKLTVQIGKLH